MHKFLISVATALALFSTTSHAEDINNPTINDYLNNINGDMLNQLSNIGRGFEVSNIWLSSNNRERIYCSPDSFVLSGSQYEQILKNIVNKNKFAGEMEVQYLGIALLEGLRDTFPCHK